MGACLVPGEILSLDGGNLLFSLFPLEDFIANLSVQRQFFPTDEDETGAAKALMRLQDTYKLDPDTISKGGLPGTKYQAVPSVDTASGWAARPTVKAAITTRCCGWDRD